MYLEELGVFLENGFLIFPVGTASIYIPAHQIKEIKTEPFVGGHRNGTKKISINGYPLQPRPTLSAKHKQQQMEDLSTLMNWINENKKKVSLG